MTIGSYRFCVFNAYFQNGLDIPDKYCQMVEIKSPVQSIRLLEPKSPVISSEAPQVAPNNGNSIQMVVAILCAAIGLVVTCLVIGGFLWRKRRFLHLKNSSINRNAPLDDSKMSYCSKLISTTLSPNKPDLTMDASKEFAVTLMLRAPPQNDYQQVHPISYPNHIGTSQTEIYDVNCNNSSRNDTSLYI